MRVAQINVTSDLSTGRIATEICTTLIAQGHKALLCHSRGYAPLKIPSYQIGNRADVLLHALGARLFDRAGFFSRHATKKLVRQLKAYKPDVVQLHNLHGYYLNLPILMDYLAKSGVPVVWTLHDCWAFTGHCAYYSMAKCDRWTHGCGHCRQLRAYPCSLLLDQSAKNWRQKRDAIAALPNLTLVVPSVWLGQQARRSFLGKRPINVIPGGIDLQQFRPCDEPDLIADVVKRYGLDRLSDRRMLLSVASTWEPRKGLADLVALSELLDDSMRIVVVGLNPRQIEDLPETVIGLPRTRTLRELRALYTAADVCLSLSHEETQGLTLIEALACGTQVLCYDATALPENVTPEVGEVVPEGDLQAVAAACASLCADPRPPEACRARAEAFDCRLNGAQYLYLYEQVTARTPSVSPAADSSLEEGALETRGRARR